MAVTPMLSVVVTTRNSASTIRSCLDSLGRNLLSLPTGEAEVIVVDGHSTDGTLEIVNSFDYPKTIVFSAAGVNQAFNEGVRHSNGRWIAFLNSDDEYADGFLTSLCKHLREEAQRPRSRPVVLHAAVQFIDSNGEALYIRYPAPYIGFIQKHYSVILHPNACYPAKLMKLHPFPLLPANRPSDRQQVYALMRHAQAKRVPEACYRFRISAHSVTMQLARKPEPTPPLANRVVGLIGRVYVQLFETRLLPRLARRLITGRTAWSVTGGTATQSPLPEAASPSAALHPPPPAKRPC